MTIKQLNSEQVYSNIWDLFCHIKQELTACTNFPSAIHRHKNIQVIEKFDIMMMRNVRPNLNEYAQICIASSQRVAEVNNEEDR